MSSTAPPLPSALEAHESHLGRRALIRRTPLQSSKLEDAARSSAQQDAALFEEFFWRSLRPGGGAI